MGKVDFKTLDRTLYRAPTGDFVLLQVPSLPFVMVDGRGDPNTAIAYAEAVRWLYSVSYALKFALKAVGQDHVVAPLEGLWSAEDPGSFVARRKDEWTWTLMIRTPDAVDTPRFAAATEKVRAKLGAPPSSLRLQRLEEGLCLQTLHVGPYEDEGPTLARLHQEVMPSLGYTFAGPHHEIYLSDPRKTAPSRLKTLLRQPVRAVEADEPPVDAPARRARTSSLHQNR
ncbi:hypothetical protein D7U74_03670 [Stenotrophomonas maltophilia]|jgi:hypothetical protein|uniref:GyrI-like domain-containing protein n=1 Tax=Stenotrophomonas maltophilia TaxID=40324 RepID=UPI0015DF1212|nr:GyrI-like domain-containing protein [Stenotrophomonas maltophilia]MBA0220660.1 hypothetical protein [Stenotrophomonas maltophilia]